MVMRLNFFSHFPDFLMKIFPIQTLNILLLHTARNDSKVKLIQSNYLHLGNIFLLRGFRQITMQNQLLVLVLKNDLEVHKIQQQFL